MIQIDDGIVKFPPSCDVGEINTQMRDRIYSIIMKLCGNTTDCKHDFGSGGPNSIDRSFMNNHDCNDTFIKEQFRSCGKIGALSKEIEQDINTLYFQKFLIREGSLDTLLVEKQITSSANTIHEIFDFTSHLIKLPFVLNDRIMIRLIQRTSSSSEPITIAQYCVCRPFYGEYQLMKRNYRFVKPYYVFDPEEYRRLKNDVETYGSNGIFCIRVGNRDSFIQYIKINPDVINKINELFHFNEKHYTIDSTHIKKEIYKPLFGSKSSECFLGDKLDPSTAKNGESIRKYSSCKNRFHFCFVRGKQIDIELEHHVNGNFTIQFWSGTIQHSKIISFESPNFTPPSVSDISSYIFENLLKGKSRIGELLSALNKIRKCFVNNKKVTPVVYHNEFFRFILQGVSSLIIDSTNPVPLTTEEMITILTSIKTKGDFIRLKDTENLTSVSEGRDAVCLTLDKFLFDLNVSLQKVWMLGDSPSTANFELIVYTRFSPEKIQNVINQYVKFVQESSEITEQIKSNFLPNLDPTNSYGITPTNFFEIKSNISNKIEDIREQNKKSSILTQIHVLTDAQIVSKIQYYITEIEEIDKQIKANLPEISNKTIFLGRLKRTPNDNFRDVSINGKDQETVIQDIKKIHYNYYVFIIQQFCREYSVHFNSSTLEQVLNLTKPDSDVISILKVLQNTFKKISIPRPLPDSQTLIFNIFKDVKREINNKSNFFSTATDVLYVKGCIKNYLKHSSIQLPGISKLPGSMEQNGGSPDIHGDDSIVDMFLYIIFSVYYHYIDEMEIIDFLDVLCDNIQNRQDESIDKTIKILLKTMNQTIELENVSGEKEIIEINNVILGVVTERLNFYMKAFTLHPSPKQRQTNYRKSKKMFMIPQNLMYGPPNVLNPYPNPTNRKRKFGSNGGNRTKKNRPKKCKKHGTRSKKLLKNKTRKHHSTRSKRKNKK